MTGLDPAGPLFSTGYLSKDDATSVLIIHSDMDGCEIGLVSGHVDCKPNFGRRIQPGCIADVAETYLPPSLYLLTIFSLMIYQ